jgi:perosamine synthetase
MSEYIPYGRQSVSEDDIATVVNVLRGDWLTTGPSIDRFEDAICHATGADHCVAVSSGTAALHAAYEAVGLGPGDEVIVPAQTFSATANAAIYLGAEVVFADVDETLTMDAAHVAELVSERTEIIAPVDFTGQPADLDAFRDLAASVGAYVVEDASHSLGAAYKGRKVGTIADLTTFSFHPVKIVTTAEGGAITTSAPELNRRLARFRTHGIERGHIAGDPDAGGWAYDIDEIGYNYRITDVQAALGVAQMGHLDDFVARRNAIASRYMEAFSDEEGIELPVVADWTTRHAWHLFVIRVDAARRGAIFERLRERGIGVQVHYIPVNMLQAYRKRGFDPNDTPRSLEAYRRMISIPCFPDLTDEQQERTIEEVRDAVRTA